MSFFDVRFPDRIARGAQGGPGFLTTAVETVAGWETRLENWSEARCRYNVVSGLKRRADLEDLIAFFRIVRGKQRGFRFKDWTDFQAMEVALGTGNGVRTTWQLAKTYSYGGGTSTRYLTRPVSGSVTVFEDGVAQSSGVSVDLATGVLTFTAAPANGVVVAATCEFDVPCRFDVEAWRVSPLRRCILVAGPRSPSSSCASRRQGCEALVAAMRPACRVRPWPTPTRTA